MSDEVPVKQEPREVHPEGQFAALCVDLIAMGMRVQEFQGNQSAAESCVLVFVTGEKNSKGYPFTLNQEMNVTTGGKSKLLKFLTGWRGKQYTPEELGTSFVLSAYVGKTALVSIIHKTSLAGNLRSEIAAIMPLPAGMPAPLRGDYKRPDFWAKKKADYAADYKRFMSKTMKGGGDEPKQTFDEAPF